MAKIIGAIVITTSGSDEKCNFARSLGADYAINYKTQDFVEETLRITDNTGADVILDMVAGSYVDRNVRSLGDDGRLVIIAVQGGVKADLNILPVMKKRLTITGSTLRPRDDGFKSAIANALHENIWPLIEAGKITPVIDKTFALEDVIKAHEYLEAGNLTGKVILTV